MRRHRVLFAHASPPRSLDFRFILAQVIRRSQADSARPPAGKLTLQVQVPRFTGDEKAQQQHGKIRRQDSNARTGSSYDDDDDARQASFEGTLQPLPPLVRDQQKQQQHVDEISVTASFVVTYSGQGEIRDATLNISAPPGFSADPPSVALPPVRGKGNAAGTEAGEGRGGGEGSGDGAIEPLVVPVVLSTERGTVRIPSTLIGQASVVYSRRDSGGDGRSQPMSARCELRLPLTLAGRLVEPTARKGGNTHKFTFNTSRPAVRLTTLFEDMTASLQAGGWSGASNEGSLSSSTARGGSLLTQDCKSNGAGGAPAVGVADGGGTASISGIGADSTTISLRYWAAGADTEVGSQDVSVAVSKNSGRYRVQSESLPALCVVAAEVVRRLKEYFGESVEGRDRSNHGRFVGDEGKTGQDEGETLGSCPCRSTYPR